MPSRYFTCFSIISEFCSFFPVLWRTSNFLLSQQYFTAQHVISFSLQWSYRLSDFVVTSTIVLVPQRNVVWSSNENLVAIVAILLSFLTYFFLPFFKSWILFFQLSISPSKLNRYRSFQFIPLENCFAVLTLFFGLKLSHKCMRIALRPSPEVVKALNRCVKLK